MSKFEVPGVPIRAIEPIVGADAIELAVVGEYRSVVKKNTYKAGDVVIYIPEGSVVPDWLLAKMGLTDKLDGSGKNRVKARKLRGCLSQGLILGLEEVLVFHPDNGKGPPHVSCAYTGLDENIGSPDNFNYANILGIYKYEPPIPASMAGEVCNIHGHTIAYDIENNKKYPDVLDEGEPVIFTEKLHGTYCQIGVVPGLDHKDLYEGMGYIASKGLGAQGLVFKFNDRNAGNVYFRAIANLRATEDSQTVLPIWDRLLAMFGTNAYLMGEVYGQGVQDLAYGEKNVRFRAFDLYVGLPGQGRYLNVDEKIAAFEQLGVEMVPVLYRGPYSKELAALHRDGKTVAGNGANIREGIVITPDIERIDNSIGRVILKDVSADYLLRKGDATEFT